jgi:hypothetical protein
MGAFVSGEVLSALGPRQHGQFSAAACERETKANIAEESNFIETMPLTVPEPHSS